MIVYPAEYNPRKEAVFAALAAVDGGHRLRIIPLRYQDYPETTARTDTALARAKRQPKNAVLRWLKRQLIRGQYNWARAYFATHPDHIAVAWNGLTGSRMAFMQGAKDAGAAQLYAELAPLPDRITLDPAGVNAEGSVPLTSAFYQTWAKANPQAVHNWRDIGASLTARPSRRADVGQGGGALPETPYIFCPLQVPDDSQITLFAGWVGGMAGYIAALGVAASHLPQGWHLRLKEHPSAKTSLRPLLEPLLATGRVILDNDTDSFAQIAASFAVVTLNSSMGLQAFFHDKPVILLGRAFFAIDGLVTIAPDQAALNAQFADPGALTYDAALRAAFIAWLAQDYYSKFTFSDGKTTHDRGAFAAKLQLARISAKRLL